MSYTALDRIVREILPNAMDKIGACPEAARLRQLPAITTLDAANAARRPIMRAHATSVALLREQGVYESRGWAVAHKREAAEREARAAWPADWWAAEPFRVAEALNVNLAFRTVRNALWASACKEEK